MLLQIGNVRFNIKDLMAFHAADAGVIGQKHVEGIYVNLILRGAPTPVKAALHSEKERDRVLIHLDNMWRRYHKAKLIKRIDVA